MSSAPAADCSACAVAVETACVWCPQDRGPSKKDLSRGLLCSCLGASCSPGFPVPPLGQVAVLGSRCLCFWCAPLEYLVAAFWTVARSCRAHHERCSGTAVSAWVIPTVSLSGRPDWLLRLALRLPGRLGPESACGLLAFCTLSARGQNQGTRMLALFGRVVGNIFAGARRERKQC